MPLYIRDDQVDQLAEAVMATTGAKTKTDAVRAALEAALEQAKSRQSLFDRLGPVWNKAASMGSPDPNFDMKSFTDEMWGDS